MIAYSPISDTLRAFHASDKRIRCIRGPVGSGKSVACINEVMIRAMNQEPCHDGVVRFRIAIIRNTYPDLMRTTLKSWEQWFPEGKGGFGRIRRTSPIEHNFAFEVPLVDGGKRRIEIEAMFLSMDKPQDVSRLLSLELTAFWINEAREVPEECLLGLLKRVGRFPSKVQGTPSWSGGWMDTNSMGREHWLAKLEQSPPEAWEFFKQPPAMFESKDSNGKPIFTLNPDADNLDNLPPNYYELGASQDSPADTRLYVCNKFGIVNSGRPVFHDEFDEVKHVSKESLAVVPGQPVFVGADTSGLRPAALYLQNWGGQWRVLHEIVCQNTSADVFGDMLNAGAIELNSRVPGNAGGLLFKYYGDPSGALPRDTDNKSYFEHLRKKGLRFMPAPSQAIQERLEACRRPMLRKLDEDRPGFIISGPDCRFLVQALAGQYAYKKKLRAESEFDVHPTPEKNIYSDVCDALQYALMSGGEYGGARGTGRQAPIVRDWQFDPMARPHGC